MIKVMSAGRPQPRAGGHGGGFHARCTVNRTFRLIQPINGAQLSQQGTHKPSIDECLSAPYSGSPVLQTQMPVGVWACVTTSSGNVGRIRIANINGVPGIPVPMTIFLDHTTWSATGGPGGGFGGPGGVGGGGFGGPGGGGGFGGPGGGFGGPGGGGGGGLGGVGALLRIPPTR
jgi:hypothetical protein